MTENRYEYEHIRYHSHNNYHPDIYLDPGKKIAVESTKTAFSTGLETGLKTGSCVL